MLHQSGGDPEVATAIISTYGISTPAQAREFLVACHMLIIGFRIGQQSVSQPLPEANQVK